ncbi:MAG: tetratricopeptide repeat protein [Planctomycetota bacterium]
MRPPSPDPDPAKPDAAAVPPLSFAFAARLAERYGGAPTDAAPRASEAPPTPSDRYLLRDEVAHGGMGAVYEVWDRDLDRVLAMKVMRTAATDSARSPSAEIALLRRFIREAKITGQLDHPGVVPIHELGFDGAQRPFFTMKLVDGRELGEIFQLARARHEGWQLARALEVLIRVTDTVAYAHARGVVHRDLKPANVLVGEYGEVYVMDWGLAKVLGVATPDEVSAEDVADSNEEALTLSGSVLGTPSYMSPEQAQGKSELVSPATDVYALGALLYLLLSGRAPYSDLIAETETTARAREIVEHVRRGPPTVLATLAPEAPPELVEVCERAMARESTNRYLSAADLASKLRDYLAAQQQAALDANENRKIAARARAFSDFLLQMFQVANPSEEKSKNMTVHELIERGLEKLKREPPGGPDVQAMLLTAFGNIYRSLGHHDDACRVLAAAVDERRGLAVRDDAELATAIDALAAAHCSLGEFSRAEPLYREALAVRERGLGAEHPEVAETCNNLGAMLLHRGDFAGAEPLLRRALDIARRVTGERSLATARYTNDLGFLMRHLGRYGEAEAYYLSALEVRRELLGDDSVQVAVTLNNLGLVLVSLERYGEAEARLREALALRLRLVGDEHPEHATDLNSLAFLYSHLKRYDEAEVLFRRALELRSRLLGPDAPPVANCHNNLATVLRETGRCEESAQHLEAALRIFELAYGRVHASCAHVYRGLSQLREQAGDLVRAEELLKQAIAIEHEALPTGHPKRVESLIGLSRLRLRAKDARGARAAADDAARECSLSANPTDARRREIAELLAACGP